MRRVALLVATFASFALPTAVGAEGASKSVALGAVVPDFSGKDVDGKAFQLSALRVVRKEEALAATLAAAKTQGLASPTAADLVESLPGILGDDGHVDPRQRCRFLTRLAKPWGMIATEAIAPKTKTLGEVATWLESASTAPIVFLVWSPRCP